MKNLFLRNKNIFLFALFILVLAGAFLFSERYFDERSGMNRAIVTIANHEFVAWVADTEPLQERGLGGVKNLSDKQAMIFVFDKPDKYPFWMKDMLIPIDMAWFDSNRKLLYVAENVSPNTYPKTFESPTDALYVLETKAGEMSSIGAKVGDVMLSKLFDK